MQTANTRTSISFKVITQVIFAVWLTSCGGSLHDGAQPGTGGSVGTGQAGALGMAGYGAAGTGGTGGDGGGGTGAPATAGIAGAGPWTDGGIGGSGGKYECPGAGAGGIQGTSALSGAGGPAYCPPSPPPSCGSDVCGNGQVDSCAKPMTASCVARTDKEACDGSNLGGESCTSRGYGSGTLRCTTDCGFDLGGCTECAALGPVLTGCRRLPFASNGAGSIALGASDAEVGLALLSSDPANGPPLSFARLTPTLEVVDTTVLEAVAPTWCDHRWVGAAVAPLSSGWVVAVAGDPEVFVHVLDATGRSVARTVVDQLAPFASVGDPILVSRPGGGPLLVWPTDLGVRASVLSADGRSFTPPITLPVPNALQHNPVGAAYMGGDFYVVHTQPPYSDPLLGGRRGFTLARIDTNGQLVSRLNILPDERVILDAVTAGAGDLRLLYSDSDPVVGVGYKDTVLFRRINSAGEPLTPAVSLGSRADFRPIGYAFAASDDTLALFGALEEPGYASRISQVRLASDGTRPDPVQMIVRVPNQVYLEGAVATRRGPDVVVAWKKNFMLTGLDIARLTP